MKKNFRDRATDHSRPTNDQPMYQYFGQEVSTPIEKPAITQEIEETVANVLDNSKIEKAGYWVMIGVLSILLISFIIKTNITGIVSSVMMIGLFFIGVRKITFSYNATVNYYLANVTVTLKAMLRNFSLTNKLVPHAEKVLIFSVLSLIIEHFLLRWFLFAPISSAIYTVGFYGMWVGIVLCFATRETAKAYRGLTLAYLYYIITIFFNGLFIGDIYIFTVVSSFIIWTIAGWMKNFVIEDIQVAHK